MPNNKYRKDENGRVCGRCKRYLAWSEFGFNATGFNGHSSFCYTCNNKRTNNHDKYIARLIRDYGITKEEATRLSNVSSCEICGITLTKGENCSTRHCVDHNARGVRGVLCQHCNAAIGLMRDDHEILLKAIRYLQKGK